MDNQHFAASWLKSLSKKLENLPESNWVVDKGSGLAVHRNLFREFFSANFQKTLACVDAKKREDLIRCIEKNLYKFEARTQQFPLGCLCALFEHGKESPLTQDRVKAWVEFLLTRLRPGLPRSEVVEVVDECKAAAFQKFLSVMSEELKERLADELGEHLQILTDDEVKAIFDELLFVGARLEKLVESSCDELNKWLLSAPQFPATPLALCDIFEKLLHPLINYYKRIKDAERKECFLIAAALALQGLQRQFLWMCNVEPGLSAMSTELQRRFFALGLEHQQAAQVNIMEMWLLKRREKHNTEVERRIAELDSTKCQLLQAHLASIIPERKEGEASDWVAFHEPSALQDAILKWFEEHSKGFFCPRHTLTPNTIAMLLRRSGRMFEVDAEGRRVRLADPKASLRPPVPPPPPPSALVSNTAGNASQQIPAALRLLPGTPGVLSLASGSVQSPGVLSLASGSMSPGLHQGKGTTPAAQAPPPIVDNLIDFLLNEALESVPADLRAKVQKLSHGVYRVSDREVTLHTKNGHLFVYRVGEAVQHMPIETFIQQELSPPSPEKDLLNTGSDSATKPEGNSSAPASAPSAVEADAVGAAGTAQPAVDTTSVQRIAQQSAQISAGTATVTPMPHSHASSPFGQSKPTAQLEKSDGHKLTAKHTNATNAAIEINKREICRLFPRFKFEDEQVLRKLLKRGLKHDESWQLAYEESCSANGSAGTNYKMQSKDFITSFIARHLVKSSGEAWVVKFMSALTSEGEFQKKKKKEKDKKKDKDKDKKKDKKAKDRKRKAPSESSSSEDADDGGDPGAELGGAMIVPVALAYPAVPAFFS